MDDVRNPEIPKSPRASPTTNEKKNPAAAAADNFFAFRGRGTHHHRRSHSEVCYRRFNELEAADSFPLPHPLCGGGGPRQVLSMDDHFCNYMDLEKSATTSNNKQIITSKQPAVAAVDDDDNDDEMSSKKSSSPSSSRGAAGVLWDSRRKRAMDPRKLADLFAANPKRAKRILANRKSAARSTDRKARHILDLEQKFKALQTQATILSNRLKLFQNDTAVLNNENAELKLHLQALEQQTQLRDAVNGELKKDIDLLKRATKELASGNGGLDPHISQSFLSHVVKPGQAHYVALSEMLQQELLDRMHGFDYSSGNSRISEPEMSEEPSVSDSESSKDSF